MFDAANTLDKVLQVCTRSRAFQTSSLPTVSPKYLPFYLPVINSPSAAYLPARPPSCPPARPPARLYGWPAG